MISNWSVVFRLKNIAKKQVGICLPPNWKTHQLSSTNSPADNPHHSNLMFIVGFWSVFFMVWPLNTYQLPIILHLLSQTPR